MTMTKNAQLVEAAIQRRDPVVYLTKAMSPAMKGFGVVLTETEQRPEERVRIRRKREPYAHALSIVNDHITVKQEIIDDAATSYEKIADRLVSRLDWPPGAIKVFPQGSASTKTLIRTVGNRKFDIDAVCEIDLSQVEAQDPMAFFNAIGDALEGLKVEKRRRCWSINILDKPFYVEFTPSVPLAKVPLTRRQSHGLKHAEPAFLGTALAVVNTPTQDWKTSNPLGIRDWVNRVAERKIVLALTLEAYDSAVRANIEPVGKQSVDVEETLRVAIRLFKRHRDMCVHRGLLTSEVQPISIILVTLLTICYDGLADLIEGRYRNPYFHVMDALVALADLLPEMISRYPDLGYYLANPTVVDENFAERWNDDEGERAEAFQTWCGLLRADLLSIAALSDAEKIKEKTLEVFGCTAAERGPGGGNGGSEPITALAPPPNPAPRTSGLA